MYWICSANNIGVLFVWGVYICIGYILPTIVECCSVGGCLCALRAQGWVMYIFLDMCLYWIYSANNYGVLFTWWGVCVPFGHRVGSLIFLRYVFVLDIFCQQLWGVVHLMGCLCALRAQGWVMYNKRDNCNIRRTSTRRTSARPF